MCAGTERAARGRGRHRVGAEDSAGAQVGDVGHTDPGQGVDQVRLRGADAVGVVGAGAECASGSHPAIVRTAAGRRGAPEAPTAAADATYTWPVRARAGCPTTAAGGHVHVAARHHPHLDAWPPPADRGDAEGSQQALGAFVPASGRTRHTANHEVKRR